MNANKIQSVISSCRRRALSSVAMGTVKSVLDQRKTHTYLLDFPTASLTLFGFKPHMLPRNMRYLTSNICHWSNDRGLPTQGTFTHKFYCRQQQWLVCWSSTFSIILRLVGTG